MTRLNEAAVEEAALDILRGLGYAYVFGPSIAPGEPAAERVSCEQVVHDRLLRDSLLQKLVSGELRVQDAVRAVKEVG